MAKRKFFRASAGSLCLAALVALALAGAAAAKQLAPGSDGHGVRAVRYRGLTLIFGSAAAARYRQIAGRRIEITCSLGVLTGPSH